MRYPVLFHHNNRLRILLAATILLLLLSGCRQADRMYAWMQYANPKIGIRPGLMTITTGDGRFDIRRAMAKQAYAGEVRNGRVTVHYLEGTREKAEKAAEDFDTMYPLVKRRLGMDWSFDLVLKFVEASDVPRTGWTYSEKIRPSRRMTFPVVVTRGPQEDSPVSAALVAHEVTEASMLYPERRRLMLLGDAWFGPVTIPYHTRWFRDGLADYAADVFSHDVLRQDPIEPPSFNQLAEVKESILKWENPDGPDDYGAAQALIREITFRAGEDSIPQIFQEIERNRATGGSALQKAVKRATGMDLRQFLSNYQTSWLGFSVYQEGGGLRVNHVWEGTPASRWGIERLNRVISLGGNELHSTTDFAVALARVKVGDAVDVVVETPDGEKTLRMKTIPHPSDLALFERLNSYVPGSASGSVKKTSQHPAPSQMREPTR